MVFTLPVDAYSDLKAAWHTDKIDSLRSGRQIVPAQVHFIISDLCNHDCHFCSYRMSNGISSEQFAENGNHNPNRMIPTEKCYEILADLAMLGVKAVQFTGGGEPTVHPDHIGIIQRSVDLGLDAALVTNGYLLREGWQEVFPLLSWLRVSIDAGSPEVYSSVRRLNSQTAYHKTLANVTSIALRLKETGSSCLFGAGYVVTRENWQDLVAGVETLRECGVSYVRLAAMFSSDHEKYYNGLEVEIREQIAAARLLEREGFAVIDLFGQRMSDLRQHAPDYDFCGYQQFVTYIGGNQKVYRCCSTSYTKHGEIGDLHNQSFRQWFDSQEKQEAIAGFNARSCKLCQFNDKNATINYMLRPQPQHVNFV